MKALNDIPTLRDPNNAGCPIHELISRLGDRWSMFVLMALDSAEGKQLRFSEVKKKVNGISQRMLTTTLRYMERDGIVTRQLFPAVPPRVVYTLTARGEALLVPVQGLVAWIRLEWPEIDRSRKVYDSIALNVSFEPQVQRLVNQSQ